MTIQQVEDNEIILTMKKTDMVVMWQDLGKVVFAMTPKAKEQIVWSMNKMVHFKRSYEDMFVKTAYADYEDRVYYHMIRRVMKHPMHQEECYYTLTVADKCVRTSNENTFIKIVFGRDDSRKKYMWFIHPL
jgi:hypothetical protein